MNSTHPAWLYLGVFLVAVALYAATCAPGPVWQDSGMIQYRVWHNDIEGRLGLALSHPLFYIIAIGAKYIGFGEFGHRVNLVSSLTAAFAVANIFLLLRLWFGKFWPGLIGAVTLALSHTFWRHATIAETYNLYTALLLAELIVILQFTRTKRVGWLYLLGLLNGLAISNHMLASIGFVCYAVFLAVLLKKKEVSLKHIGIIGLLWILGAGPYEYLIIKNIIQTGDLVGTMASAAFGSAWQKKVLNTSISVGIVKENIMFLLLNFPTPNLLLFFAGLWGLKKLSPSTGFRNILLALLVLFFVFAFRYTVPDRYAFFIPFYCMVAILIGVGFNHLAENYKGNSIAYLVVLLGLLTIPAYILAPAMAKRAGIFKSKREIPYRDAYTYFLQPWRTGYRGAERFANEALDTVDENGIICADGTTAYALIYAQEINGKRPDVSIVTSSVSIEPLKEYNEEAVGRIFDERAIYVVAGFWPEFLHKNYDFERGGVVWRVVEKK